MANIKIWYGKPDGTLTLSDNGRTDTIKGDKIKWQIQDRSSPGKIKVVSIELVAIKSDPQGIIMGIRRQSDNKWQADISRTAADYSECDYLIKWKDPNGTVRTYDPKIAIRPTFSYDVFFAAIIAALLAIFTIQLFKKKK